MRTHSLAATDVPLFRARSLTRTYHVGEVDVHALQGLDLDLFEKELVVILGPSGSGKSTLLNILGGLDAPTSGDVRFRDHDLVRAGERELTRYRREHVGFVFQFYNLIPSLTALENVALVTEIATHASLNKVTTLRILDVLVREGYVRRDEGTKTYSLGDQALVLAAAARNGVCVATADEDCRKSADCRTNANCSALDGVCAPGRDEDCRRTELCKLAGRCTAKNGSCVPGSDDDCLNSQQCVDDGSCALVDGKCAPVEAEHAALKKALVAGKVQGRHVAALTDAIVAHEPELRAFAGL